MNKDDLLWVERYRPTKIEDTILPERLKQPFLDMVSSQKIPHLMLCGDAGMGKTTVARALCDELDSEYMLINSSIEGRIDILRDKVANFASGKSLMNKNPIKTVIFDEADNLTPDTQKGLRGFMEKHQNHVRFIFTCNFKNKIIEPIHSRCVSFDFEFQKDERQLLAQEFLGVMVKILDENSISYDKKTIAHLLREHFPDFRKVLSTLHGYSLDKTKQIDEGILGNIVSANLSELVSVMKAGNWPAMRKWVDENSTIKPESLVSELWSKSTQYFTLGDEPHLCEILEDYQRHAHTVPDPNITLAFCLTQIMVKCEFK